ncbi:MAG: hypothetical protein D8M59_03800 [Planctomycetes bacterium]|nr:hypothetical protein [Planctomycetota bacterium]NOG53119.1 hypothetical protein [Planctomycetota bacterium]
MTHESASSVTIEFDVHFRTGQRGRKRAAVGKSSSVPEEIPGRLPRITRLMALAIRFDHLITTGEIADYAEIARLGQITRARVTQVMNLLHLAPDIQQAVLSLPRVDEGRDLVTERDLRPIVAVADWGQQRMMWEQVAGRVS